MKKKEQDAKTACNDACGKSADGDANGKCSCNNDADAEASRKDAGSDAACPQDDVKQETKLSELDALKDQFLRLRADFDNYRKRVARDQIETIKRANEDLVESLLPALDHFGSAESMMEQKAGPEAAPYLEGFRMVKNELSRVLESYGLKPIPALGEQFDANVHEALSTQISETAAPESVVFEIRKGYTLNGRVLRASQVIVAAEPELEPNNAAPAPAADAESAEEGAKE